MALVFPVCKLSYKQYNLEEFMKRFTHAAVALALCMTIVSTLSCTYVIKQIKEDSTRTTETSYGNASQSTAPQKSAPVTVYVTFRNHCGNTVKLFFGEKPPFSSGVETSVSGNSVDSRSISTGTLVWIVDDSGKPISSTTVSDGTGEIHINGSGTGFGEN
jgi:hypothetical protein